MQKAGPPVGSSKQNMSRKDFLELYSDPSAKKQWQRGDTTDGGLGTQEGKERGGATGSEPEAFICRGLGS